MTDILHNLMHPLPNAIMTVIMGVLALYWLFVFISGAGLEDLDLGFDFDVDVPDADVPEVDADNNVDTSEPEGHASGEKHDGFFIKFMKFLNVGKVPFMLILSTFKFLLWIGSLITTQFINVTTWGLSAAFILIPLSVVAIFFTKFATNPMVKFFNEIGYKGEDEIDFLGRSGKMISNIKDKKIGSAEVTVDNNPIRLNVMSINGEELKYGDYITIENESDDKKTYYVSKEISLRNL